MKWIVKEIKNTLFSKRSLSLLAATTAVMILAACDAPKPTSEAVDKPTSSSSMESPKVENSSSSIASSSEPSSISEVVEELPPEPIYSEWVEGEWTTEKLEESDTCKLVNTKEDTVYTEWSELSTTPIEGTETREVNVVVKKEEIIKGYVDLPRVGPDGYIIPGEFVKSPSYLLDEDGRIVRQEVQYYQYRDLKVVAFYQYAKRELINEDELASYSETKKL